MEALVRHVLAPVLAHPDALQVQSLEGEAATVLEIIVHADDRLALEADDAQTLRAARTILSAAAGRRKATIEVVDEFSDPEAQADSSDLEDEDDSDDSSEA
jgi:predicted RNA-binding protein YlqC (UPF0109 family)